MEWVCLVHPRPPPPQPHLRAFVAPTRAGLGRQVEPWEMTGPPLPPWHFLPRAEQLAPWQTITHPPPTPFPIQVLPSFFKLVLQAHPPPPLPHCQSGLFMPSTEHVLSKILKGEEKKIAFGILLHLRGLTEDLMNSLVQEDTSLPSSEFIFKWSGNLKEVDILKWLRARSVQSLNVFGIVYKRTKTSFWMCCV